MQINEYKRAFDEDYDDDGLWTEVIFFKFIKKINQKKKIFG